MSTKYKAAMPDTGYFVTITIVCWVDIFTRLKQRYIIMNALNYCQEQKGLEIYAYCIMSSHIHMLCKVKEGYLLSNSMRDFKKFTSKQRIETIINFPESRREWLFGFFNKACEHLKRIQTYKVWQDGYHAEICGYNTCIKQKLNYMHNNPIIDKIVANPKDYVFSAARNYADLDGELDVVVLAIF
ncbi:MAG: REP element-mobilizing transposase RayT [Polaribacter sp.]|jgi:REP element-mobilizing transposase RayT